MLMQKIRKSLSNHKGFTLVELLVVVAILGVLAALVVPKLANSTTDAKQAKIKADLRSIDGAFAIDKAKGGTATTIAGLVTANLLAAEPTPPSLGTGTPPTAYGVVGDATAGYRGTYDSKTIDTLSF